MAGHDIIVIGASAGGIQALQELVGGLPKDFPASLFIVVHTAPSSAALLPQILRRHTDLTAEYAVDDRGIEPGKIYVAPPDHHLLIKPRRLCVVRGPKENGFRPAVDPLFRSAARAYGPRVIGVILSGGLNDGTAGLSIVKRFGGVAIVQDPREAPFPSMPESAMQNLQVDHVLKIAQMPSVLTDLAHEQAPEGADLMAKRKAIEPDVAEVGTDALVTGELPGPPSGFTCPECGGALWELRGGKILRFRCHVGHGYTAESLMADQTNGVEAALWAALRALEEAAALRRRMADRAAEGNYPIVVKQYREQAREAEDRAAIIRTVLVSDPGNGNNMKKTRPRRSAAAGRGKPKATSRVPSTRKGDLAP